MKAMPASCTALASFHTLSMTGAALTETRPRNTCLIHKATTEVSHKVLVKSHTVAALTALLQRCIWWADLTYWEMNTTASHVALVCCDGCLTDKAVDLTAVQTSHKTRVMLGGSVRQFCYLASTTSCRLNLLAPSSCRASVQWAVSLRAPTLHSPT